MQGLHEAVQEAATAVRAKSDVRPKVGIILGSGLGGLADKLENPIRFPYAALPHFPNSTAAGHAGQLILGTLGDKPVLAMQGRFHLYEGNSAQQAALPIWLMRELGITTLVVTNAAGGLNPLYQVGDVMVIEDQINMMYANPLVGVNDDRLGPRFPDMSQPYDQELIELALQTSLDHKFHCRLGVYVAMLGPTYETRAEYRMTRSLGGDAVGMSTVPEVIAAQHAGIRVLGMSTITNACSPDQLGETTHEEVMQAAASAGEKLEKIVQAVVAHS